MDFIVDWGNTRLKLGIFEEDHLIESRLDLTAEQLPGFINAQKPDKLIISSVNQDTQSLAAQLDRSIPVVWFNPQTPVPVQNKYGSPQTLGADRLASVVGASHLFPGSACLVIDAGTCITYDMLTAKGEYLGGGISPGLDMRFKALNSFTARLPLVEAEPEAELIGDNTRDSILSGVINGTVAELEGIIGRYQKKFSNINILICGGNARFFESKIKADIFVVSDLVLIGLNEILQYNDPKIDKN